MLLMFSKTALTPVVFFRLCGKTSNKSALVISSTSTAKLLLPSRVTGLGESSPIGRLFFFGLF
jgi:hypothetical protein